MSSAGSSGRLQAGASRHSKSPRSAMSANGAAATPARQMSLRSRDSTVARLQTCAPRSSHTALANSRVWAEQSTMRMAARLALIAAPGRTACISLRAASCPICRCFSDWLTCVAKSDESGKASGCMSSMVSICEEAAETRAPTSRTAMWPCARRILPGRPASR